MCTSMYVPIDVEKSPVQLYKEHKGTAKSAITVAAYCTKVPARLVFDDALRCISAGW